MSKAQSIYSLKSVGSPGSLDFRLYMERKGSPISIWHDIPLWADEEEKVLNMVVEIPRWSNAKFEVRSVVRRHGLPLLAPNY